MLDDDKSRAPQEDGHVKEWEDRARVILDMKKEVDSPTSAHQSPSLPEDFQEDVEEKSEEIRPGKPGKTETPY